SFLSSITSGKGNPLMPSVSCSSYSALASKPPFFLTTTLAPSKYHSTSVGVSSESSVEVSNNVSSTLMVEGSNGALKCRVIASLESMYSPSGGRSEERRVGKECRYGWWTEQ